MSTLLAATLQNRAAGPARIGPYPTALLARERAVLLEWVSPANKCTRRRGRLRASSKAGSSLTVDLRGPDTAGVPAAGTRVMLVVPVQNSLWRFTTVSELDAPMASAISLAWPGEVMQEAGRRFERANCMLPITVTLDGKGDGRALCTYTLDVSMGGAQIVTPTQYSLIDRLKLSIRLPQETISAEATVAWCRTVRDEPGDPMYTVGVKFVSMAPRAATRLRMLLGANGAAAR